MRAAADIDPAVLAQCREQLLAGAKHLGLNLDPDQYQQLVAYLQLLYKWNRAYNLTSVREPLDMVSRHLLDSLSVVSCVAHYPRVIDVGTGPGLPGIPLAISLPHHRFTLLDSNGKRTRFLQQVKMQLGLSNVAIHQGRVETLAPDEGFDAVISRAFASLADMLHWCQQVCAKEGVFLAMKGQYPEAELAHLPSGFSLLSSQALEVPGSTAERHLLVLQAD